MGMFRRAAIGFVAMALWAYSARALETRGGYASIYGLELLGIEQIQQGLKLDDVQAQKLADYYQNALARFKADNDELNKNRALLPREKWEGMISEFEEARLAQSEKFLRELLILLRQIL